MFRGAERKSPLWNPSGVAHGFGLLIDPLERGPRGVGRRCGPPASLPGPSPAPSGPWNPGAGVPGSGTPERPVPAGPGKAPDERRPIRSGPRPRPSRLPAWPRESRKTEAAAVAGPRCAAGATIAGRPSAANRRAPNRRGAAPAIRVRAARVLPDANADVRYGQRSLSVCWWFSPHHPSGRRDRILGKVGTTGDQMAVARTGTPAHVRARRGNVDQG